MMSKVNCEAVGKRRKASLRMARAELLQIYRKAKRTPMRMHRRSYKGESYEKLKKLLVCITFL